MSKMTHEVFFFDNGGTAVFDEKKQQVGELQEAWLLVFAEFLKSKGIEPLNVTFNLPGGRKAALFALPDGSYNWNVE